MRAGMEYSYPLRHSARHLDKDFSRNTANKQGLEESLRPLMDMCAKAEQADPPERTLLKDCGEFRTNWDGIVSNWTQLARGHVEAKQPGTPSTANCASSATPFRPTRPNGFTGACPTSTRKFHASRNCSRSWGPRCSRGCWPRCCSSTFRSSAPCPCSLRRCGPSVPGTPSRNFPGYASGNCRTYSTFCPTSAAIWTN